MTMNPLDLAAAVKARWRVAAMIGGALFLLIAVAAFMQLLEGLAQEPVGQADDDEQDRGQHRGAEQEGEAALDLEAPDQVAGDDVADRQDVPDLPQLPAEGAEAVSQGTAAAIVFGHHYISNPDLAERVRAGAPLVEPDARFFYSPGARGYTDYPALATS